MKYDLEIQESEMAKGTRSWSVRALLYPVGTQECYEGYGDTAEDAHDAVFRKWMEEYCVQARLGRIEVEEKDSAEPETVKRYTQKWECNI